MLKIHPQNSTCKKVPPGVYFLHDPFFVVILGKLNSELMTKPK